MKDRNGKIILRIKGTAMPNTTGLSNKTIKKGIHWLHYLSPENQKKFEKAREEQKQKEFHNIQPLKKESDKHDNIFYK